MSGARKARLDVIDDRLGSDETVIVEVLALLFDPGGGLKKREAEGWLVLTNRRLVVGTAKHGILIDLPMKEIKVPATIKDKFTSVCSAPLSALTRTRVIMKATCPFSHQ
jgi:hypothetical protein